MLRRVQTINERFPQDIRRLIGSYEPSELFVNDEEIHRMIMEIDPEFSLYHLYIRYIQYENRLKLYSNVLGESGVTEIVRILEENNNIGIRIDLDRIELVSPDEDVLTQIVGDIELDERYVGSHIIEYTAIVESSDDGIVSFDTLRKIILYHVLTTYVNPSLYVPMIGNHEIYINVPKQPFGSTCFRQEYVDRIKEIDPDFSMAELYRSLSEQKSNAMSLRRDILDILVREYDNIKSIDYRDARIYIYSIEEIMVEGTYDEFIKIIDNLYYGVNVGHELLENYIYYGTLSLYE